MKKTYEILTVNADVYSNARADAADALLAKRGKFTLADLAKAYNTVLDVSIERIQHNQRRFAEMAAKEKRRSQIEAAWANH